MRSESGLEPGRELGGRYRLEERIGAGGMGEVWRGVDLRLRRPVAIKILPAGLAADRTAAERFRREAETTAALQHPGITVMFDIDEHQDERGSLLFLVMELLTGRDLGAVLADRPGGLPIPEATSLIAQVADALAAAHAHGVIHRDIKPANLFLLNDGRVKICDFGIARLADARTRLTATGGFVGTPQYMAPEQFRGETLDARVDLYALGCVLYELLTGAPPFTSDTGVAAVMYRHLNEPPPPPRSRRPEVPEHLERLTLDLLAKDPGGRPAGAAAVAAVLGGRMDLGHRTTLPPDRAAGAVTPPTMDDRPGAPPETVTSAGRRRKGVLAAVGAIAAAAAVTGAGVVAAQAGLGGGGGGKATHGATTTGPAATGTRGVAAAVTPVTPGWQVVLAPRYGVAYDVPPGWKIEAPSYASWVQDAKGEIYVAMGGVADRKKGRCAPAQAGMAGGSDPLLNPSSDQMGPLTRAAEEEAKKWAAGAYGDVDPPSRPPRTVQRPSGTVTVHGITAAHARLEVTATVKTDACTPPHAVVETVAMGTTRNASVSGPLVFTVLTDRDVPGQLSDADITKIIASIRAYHCPAGTVLQRYRCANASASPTA